jgi:hypothetical protein
MNFGIRSGASAEEINAVVQRALQAMNEAGARGEPMDVALLFDEDEEESEDNEDRNSNNNSNNNNNNNEIVATTIEDTVEATVDDDDDSVCRGCGEDPCLFVRHKESLEAYDEYENVATEDIPSNNLRRKKLYRQLTLMINGGPLGAGVRKPLPDCCVEAIREKFPSDIFMGFKAE